MSFLLSIFLESAWTACVLHPVGVLFFAILYYPNLANIPIGSESTFFAMKAFGGHDMTMPFLLAIIGATLGQSFNWLLGGFLLSYKDKFNVSDYWLDRVSTLFNQYGIFLLLFCWAPLCNTLVVLAGFVGAKPKIVLPLVVAGEMFNYGWYLL